MRVAEPPRGFEFHFWENIHNAFNWLHTRLWLIPLLGRTEVFPGNRCIVCLGCEWTFKPLEKYYPNLYTDFQDLLDEAKELRPDLWQDEEDED